MLDLIATIVFLTLGTLFGMFLLGLARKALHAGDRVVYRATFGKGRTGYSSH